MQDRADQPASVHDTATAPGDDACFRMSYILHASSSGYTGKTFPKTGKFFPKRTNSESKQKDRPKAVSVFTIGF